MIVITCGERGPRQMIVGRSVVELAEILRIWKILKFFL